MPKHKIHRLIDRIVLGREYPHVHRWMDEPYKILGKKHRILRHDPITLFLKYGPSPEFISGLLHIMADRGESLLKKRRKRRKYKYRR